MKLAFYHVDLKPEGRRITTRMVASLRETMPGVEIVQFGRVPEDAIPGITELRAAPDGPLVLSSLRCYASIEEGDWIFFDTDVIVQEDLSPVFQHPFDLAVVSREGTLIGRDLRSSYMTRMPYNKAVVFSRCPAFWKLALAWLEDRPNQWRRWDGDQYAMCEAIRTGGHLIRVLPCHYNYPPKFKGDDVSQYAVAHYKGSRKRWMPC